MKLNRAESNGIVLGERSEPKGWNCSIYNMCNDILDYHCTYCKYCKRPEILEVPAIITAIRRAGIFHDPIQSTLEILLKGELMSDDKDLYVKIFAQEKILVKDMDYVQLQARRKELADIVREVKTRIAAVDDTERTRKAKLSQEQKEWLVSNNSTDPTVSDAIDAVERRKKRMSKADKLSSQLSNLFGDDTATELMNNVAKVQTSSSVSSDTSRKLVDKRPPAIVPSVSTNTQQSLLGDITTGIVNGINTRPIEDLVEAAKTAGHIANKILGKMKEEIDSQEKNENEAKPKLNLDLSFLKK